MRFKHDGIAVMDAADLLKALGKDEGFVASLKNKELDKCAVTVGACADIEGPTAAEEAAAKKLVGGATIASKVAGSPPILFIRVALPAAAGESSRSYLALARLSRHALTVELRSGV
jgi:hypothetical protein